MSEGGITGKGFKKGDPRINRKGRPRNIDALRKLAQQVAVEEVGVNGNNEIMTRIELILRAWALSKNPHLQKAFIEYAYGKVPDKHEVTGADGRAIIIDWNMQDEPDND